MNRFRWGLLTLAVVALGGGLIALTTGTAPQVEPDRTPDEQTISRGVQTPNPHRATEQSKGPDNSLGVQQVAKEIIEPAGENGVVTVTASSVLHVARADVKAFSSEQGKA